MIEERVYLEISKWIPNYSINRIGRAVTEIRGNNVIYCEIVVVVVRLHSGSHISLKIAQQSSRSKSQGIKPSTTSEITPFAIPDRKLCVL